MIFKWCRNWGNCFPRTGKETKVGTENEDRNEIERRHEGFPHSPTWTSRKSSSVCPHTDHRLWPQRKGGEERHLRQQGRCGESRFQWPIGVYRTRIPNLTNSWRKIWMMEKKFPLPGEVLSENHQFRTSKPPIHESSILAGRSVRSALEDTIPENREFWAPPPSRHKFPILARRGKQEASKMLQKAVSENREFWTVCPLLCKFPILVRRGKRRQKRPRCSKSYFPGARVVWCGSA